MIEFTTEKFSGPLGVLLAMIESEEMDITEIALAKIADEYVAYIKSAADIDPEEVADFLVIAAKLLFVKSKALLPYLYAAEEDEEMGDLEKQLKMYKEFVNASLKIRDLVAAKRFMFLPPLVKNRRHQFNLPVFSAPRQVTQEILHDTFLRVLESVAKRQAEKLPEKTLEPKVSIDDKILTIRKMLAEKTRINFSRLLEGAATKTEIIVSFLAILELAKQKELVFEQDELFSDIHITRH